MHQELGVGHDISIRARGLGSHLPSLQETIVTSWPGLVSGVLGGTAALLGGAEVCQAVFGHGLGGQSTGDLQVHEPQGGIGTRQQPPARAAFGCSDSSYVENCKPLWYRPPPAGRVSQKRHVKDCAQSLDCALAGLKPPPDTLVTAVTSVHLHYASQT